MPFKRIYQIGCQSILAIVFMMLGLSNGFAATTQLPNGMQCFTDATGAVIGGTVNMFFPATTSPKPTWKDSTQSALNTQPIILDTNGCAIIYGVGTYRQQVFDANGVLLWDLPTTDTSAYNSTFWAGLSGGTPNVITIVDPGFNGTDGTIVQFVAVATNTGATTVNPSGFGAISVVKDTTAGPVALTGGEITQSNVISLVYYAVSNTFHLLNAPIQSASGSASPLCGAVNLSISNDGGSPNSIINITADQIVTQNASGVVVNRSSISVSANITLGTSTSTAGGMDGESPGTSTWQYVWLIDNGASAAALVSNSGGNGLAPNLPSGYTFKCRVGVQRTDNTGILRRIIQLGSRAQWQIAAGSNTATFPAIASGSTGSTIASQSLVTLVPPTASVIYGTIQTGASTTCKIAMNGTAAFTQDTGDGLVAFGTPASIFVSSNFSGVIESTNIWYGSNSAACSAFTQGWTDRVNAN